MFLKCFVFYMKCTVYVYVKSSLHFESFKNSNRPIENVGNISCFRVSSLCWPILRLSFVGALCQNVAHFYHLPKFLLNYLNY